MLGTNAAISDDMVPFSAKTNANLSTIIKAKHKIIPIPKGNPMPPRTFCDDNATPISIKTKVENG